MPYKTKEQRKIHYEKNKDKINAQRREYSKNPEVRKRLSGQYKKWKEKNLVKFKEKSKIYKKRYDDKTKERIFEHYGKVCVCCGESNINFLSIDHINGGGTKHRKKIGMKICVWLFKNNFPDGFQTLCFNCNWGKHINGGICPHQQS